MVEHLDTDQLKIRRWGDIANGDLPPTFYKVFRSGQVLYPTRNPHLRRTAFADFDGICGEKTLTLEPNENIHARLLPFIFQTETFISYASSRMVGSTNPHVRWRDIAEYEFALPPSAVQRRIADALWAAEDAIVHFDDSVEHLTALKRVTLSRLTTRGIASGPLQQTRLGKIARHWKVLPLEDTIQLCQYGLSIPLKASGQYPILRMMNFDDGEVVADDLKFVDLSNDEFEAFRLQRDDLLFNRTNSADLVGKVGIFRLDSDYVFASYLVRLRADPTVVLPGFLNYFLNSQLGQQRMLAFATPGVSQTNISAGNLKQVPIPVPPLKEQAKIVSILDDIGESKKALIAHRARTVALKKSLLSQLLPAVSRDAHV